MKFNIDSHQWTEVGRLHQGRYGHRCFFLNGKIIVSGGHDGRNVLKSTEVIDISNGTSEKVGDLNQARCDHGMGIVHVNDKVKLIVFGGSIPGSFTNSIEEWDDDSKTWEISISKLSEAKNQFGFCQLPSYENEKLYNSDMS